MRESTRQILENTLERYPVLRRNRESIQNAFQVIFEAFQKGNALYTCGNGGSDSDARHIVGELRKRFCLPRPLKAETAAKLSLLGENGLYLTEHLESALPAFCLNENSALLSAYGNDAAPDCAFAQSLFGVAKAGDVLLCISTSGNSRNCVLAATLAKALGLVCVSLTGEKESKLSALSDVTIAVGERETYKIQELHLPVYHCLCLMLENERFGE